MTSACLALHGELAPLPSAEGEGAKPEVLGWDGRIDNRDDLLLQFKQSLRGDLSSPALVAAVYERWGIPGLARLIGDWSAVICDRAHGRVVLASDYAGIRPLYYHHQSGRLRWSGRLDLLAEEGGLTTIDETYVAGFLTFGKCPDRTPYAGIRSVPPGQAVCITAAGATTHRFWALPATDVTRFADERRYDEVFRTLFREAVSARLQTIGPVVAELSGGLDSSSVVCLANDLIRAGAVPATRLVSISYVHRNSLDVPFIREMESFCGIQGIHLSTHEVPLASEADASGSLPGDSSPLDRAAAAAALAVGARVFLTGQNGDLVTGNWFDDSLQVAAPLRRGQIRNACSQALAWSKVTRLPVLWILARAARALASPSLGASTIGAMGDVHVSQDAETSVCRDFLARTTVIPPEALISDDWKQAPPERRRHFCALTAMRELRTLQVPGGMEALDCTHPFAHRPLVEFLMTVPADVLCRPGEPRRLMRRALSDLWPPMVRARRSKSLLGSPQFEALKPIATRLQTAPRWHVVERGWVDRESLHHRLAQLKNGIDCNVPQLRQIILLECWLKHRLENRDQAVLRAS